MATQSDKPTTRRPRPASVASDQQGAAGSPTPASQWKSKTAGGTLITVPSGNTCLVRTPGMAAFMKKGIIPNSLMPFIQEMMKKGSVPESSDETVAELMNDPERLQGIIDLTDAVCVEVLVDPQVHPVPMHNYGGEILPMPIGDPRRDQTILYVDEVDFNDKMFIFNFAVGGPADLETFRTQSGLDVGNVPAGEGVELPT